MFDEDYAIHQTVDDENFLKQLEATQLMYRDYSTSDVFKQRKMARETLESLITLQLFLSQVTKNVYIEFDRELENKLDLLKRISY